MSIIGKMLIDGESFNLLSYHNRFFQQRDIAGRPRGRVNGGLISLKIEAHRDHIFHHWMMNPEQMRDLEIVFSPVTRTSKSRTIQLYDVHCAKLAVQFDNSTSSPMTYTILLSPGIYVDGGVIFEKPWKVTDLEAERTEPTPAPDQEPKIINMFFTDLKNNRIEDVTIGNEVYLHIHSRNMEGRKVDIDLDDPEVDFVYNGESLTNDTLREYSINDSNERILLEIIAPEQESYDEQLKAVDAQGNPVANLWYCIVSGDEIVLSGQTDEEGFTERIPEEIDEKSFQCFWGDEALGKIE